MMTRRVRKSLQTPETQGDSFCSSFEETRRKWALLSVIVNKSVLSVYWALGPIKVVQLVAKYSLLAKHVELFFVRCNQFYFSWVVQIRPDLKCYTKHIFLISPWSLFGFCKSFHLKSSPSRTNTCVFLLHTSRWSETFTPGLLLTMIITYLIYKTFQSTATIPPISPWVCRPGQ